MTASFALAADRLEFGDDPTQARLASLAENRGPLDLAVTLNPRLNRTPATELLSAELEWAVTTPGARLIISMPPQETKTSLARHAVLRKLQHHPERRNAIASYAVDLARTSGRFARGVIEANGSDVKDPATGARLPDRLGLKVRSDHAAAGDWSLEGHDGALYAIGVGGGLTGRPVDGVLVIDDPLKDREQADSLVYRERVWEWLTAVGETRLGPEASVVLIMTRWHEDDVVGRLIALDADLPESKREWRIINIPAQADGVTPDALEGVPGARDAEGFLVSARERTAEQWRNIRRRVGERVWASLYQGRPAPLAGGIFESAWFEDHRVTEAPPLVEIAVGVDPADTGTGDAAGILVAGRAADRQLYILADLTGQLTQAQWARRACLAWMRHGAAKIVQERNLGMRTSIPDAWAVMRRQATALRLAGGDPDGAAITLAGSGDDLAADRAQLLELVLRVDDVLSRPSTGPRVESVQPKQAKQVRAQSVTGLFETGKCHLVGRLPELEHEAETWQPGQPSPNRIDTMAMLLTRLDQADTHATIARKPAPGRGRQRVPGPGMRPGWG